MLELGYSLAPPLDDEGGEGKAAAAAEEEEEEPVDLGSTSSSMLYVKKVSIWPPIKGAESSL